MMGIVMNVVKIKLMDSPMTMTMVVATTLVIKRMTAYEWKTRSYIEKG